MEETEASLTARSQAFRAKMREGGDWGGALVISHWGFIRALTGHEVGNCQVVSCNPLESHPEVPPMAPLIPAVQTP